jgi:hypothetical protein
LDGKFHSCILSRPGAEMMKAWFQGPQLFMSGKLKVAGDLMFSAQIMNFFETPK